MAVVSTFISWDEFLGTVAQNIWLITASYNIALPVLHVPGKENGLADSLSRWYGGGLSREVVDKLLSLQWCNAGSVLSMKKYLLKNASSLRLMYNFLCIIYYVLLYQSPPLELVNTFESYV